MFAHIIAVALAASAPAPVAAAKIASFERAKAVGAILPFPSGMLVGTAGAAYPTVPAARYWRITPMGLNGASLTLTYAVAEIQGYETPGGPNVFTGGTGSAQNGITNPGANAFAGDGDTTYYGSANAASTTTHWLKYDCGVGVTRAITGIAIMPHAGSIDQCIGSFVVEYSSDDITYSPGWIELYPGGASNGQGYATSTFKTFTMPFAPASTRYWMQAFTGSNGSGFVGAAEIEWRETSGGADATGSGTATSRSFTATREVIRAFDNNTANEWASGNAGFPEWLAYDFGSGNNKTIREIYHLPRAGGNATSQSPTGFYMLTSNNGLSYAPIGWSETGITGWASTVAKIFTRP